MKKLLSLILALALIIGMIPTVFATETEETVIYSPKYVFNLSQLRDADGNTPTSQVTIANLAKYTVESETGNWKYVAAPNMHSDTQIAGSYVIGVTTTPEEDNALILSLDVDKSGLYSLAFGGFNSALSSFNIPETSGYVYGGIIDYYIVHKNVVLEKGWDVNNKAFIAEMKQEASYTDAYAEVKRIASYDWMKNTTSGHVNHTMEEIALNSGENYLFIVINKPTPASAQSAGKTYFQLRSLLLTCEATLDAMSEGLKAEYEVGDSFTLTSTATNGTGVVDADASSAVTYKTSNKNIATVDENGNVTVVGEGTAIITAETYVGDKKVIDEVKVSVPVVWSPQYVFTKSAFNNVQFTDELGAASWSVKCATNASMLNREVSTGEWIYRGGTKTYTDSSASSYTGYFNCATAELLDTSLSIYEGASDSGLNAIVFEITVDKSGWYKPTFNYYKYIKNGILNVYLVDKAEFDARSGWDITSYSYAVNQIIKPMIEGTTPYVTITHLGSVDTYDTQATSNITTSGSYTNDKAFYIDGGKYYLFINATRGGAGAETKYLHVSSIKLTRQPTLDAEISASTIEAGTTATLSSVVTSGENVDLTDSAAVTYASDNTAVAKVVGNVVTGISEGTANITATATVGGATITDTVEITVTEASAPKTITLAYSNNVDNEIIVKGRNYVRGDEVTLTADEISGYTFRHWVRGTAESGEWVSADAEYTFTLATNTYLTAVYTANSVDKIVEFFNGNGEYLSEAAVVDGKVTLPATNPKLTGFAFIRWLIGKDTELTADTILTEDITRAVAEFGSDGSSYTVGENSYGYDDEVTSTSETAVAWYRDGVQVGYGTSYTYYVWANVGEITSGEGTQKPLVVLDATAKNGARMIEYDAGGKEIIEVGILFGDSTSITVDSCEYKATSQKKLSHGQFTAKPNGDETVARGYLIYNDNGTYKVVYSN